MKKIMIAAAAVALVGAAFADACNDTCTECAVPCQFGYRLKVMVRTTVPCDVATYSQCGDCSNKTYRKPAIRRFVGAVYGLNPKEAGTCGETACGCNKWENNAYIAMWDYDNATPIALNADTTELLQLNRVGCSAAETLKTEMVFSLGIKCSSATANSDATLLFAGFGLCGNHEGKITLGSMQGYCAGLLPAYGMKKVNACTEAAICSTMAWNMCCNTPFECAYTAAYGKWTLVWDAGIAAKVNANGSALNNNAAKKASTGAGTADAVLLKDGRYCKEAACSNCAE